MTRISLVAGPEHEGQRLDIVLAGHPEIGSRSAAGVSEAKYDSRAGEASAPMPPAVEAVVAAVSVTARAV